ncbi:MAG: hypothetical protein HY266_03325 [Deltaproteobacteria bacterium]|nr:hypothetical protein [Deltaproteobacteria bacterium]
MLEKLSTFAKKLAQDISSLPEHDMRVQLLGRRLAGLEPEDAAHVLNAFYDRAADHLEFRKARATMADPHEVISVVGEEKSRLIYLASLELGLKKVSRLFTDLPPHKKGYSGYDTEEDGKMEHITLGERRTISKGWIKDKLDRLLSDPDPLVIANILNNPRITEKEAVKIASKRPNSPKILTLISTHKRWVARYTIKKALVQNPYTPPRISLGLLEFLLFQDLKEVAKDENLHPQVRMAAKERLEEKD